MGLRCLLGHDFGPSGVVREHEEDGSEMVVTERELRRCRRCGEEQVLSESTEVRAIRTEEDVRSERRDADAVAPAGRTQGADVGDEGSPLSAEASEQSVDDGMDAEATPDAKTLRNAAEPVTGPGDAGAASASETAPNVDAQSTNDGDDAADSNTSLIERAEAGFDEPADPDEEDAVILDDEDAKPERERGAWPDSGDTDGPSESPADAESPAAATGSTGSAGHGSGVDPDHDDPEDGAAETTDRDEPRSLAERAAEEDAEVMGSGPDDAPDDEPAGASSPPSSSTAESAWPSPEGEDEGFSADTATSGGPSMAYGNELTPQSTNGQGQAQGAGYETSYLDNTVEQRDGDGTIVSASAHESPARGPGVETEYYCPNCGHARPLDSSLRSGDICPECQQGYIAERER